VPRNLEGLSINFVSIFVASRRPSVTGLDKMGVGETAALCCVKRKTVKKTDLSH